MYGWKYDGNKRPPFAEEPKEGQESVWDYPRPPRLERVNKRVQIQLAGLMFVDTVGAYRVVETASPPTYYLPQSDIQMGYLQLSGGGGSICEWKGVATYWTVRVGGREVVRAGWSYPNPKSGFELIQDYIAFYVAPMDGCYVGGMRVTPQPGGFYGGWVTPDLVGPFKGDKGSSGW